MSVEVSGMTWNDMKALVERRLNKLAMCKRGAIQTDINKQMEALGSKPVYTEEEREVIQESLNEKIRKAMTPTKSVIKKANGDCTEISRILRNKGLAVKEGAFEHPDVDKWRKQSELLGKQGEEREATLDGDFQEVLDRFLLKVLDISEFPAELQRLEETTW